MGNFCKSTNIYKFNDDNVNSVQVAMIDLDVVICNLLRHEIEARVPWGSCTDMSQLAGAWALLAAQQATSHMVHCFLLNPAYTVTLLKQLKRSTWLWGRQWGTTTNCQCWWIEMEKVFNLVMSYSEQKKSPTIVPFML